MSKSIDCQIKENRQLSLEDLVRVVRHKFLDNGLHQIVELMRLSATPAKYIFVLKLFLVIFRFIVAVFFIIDNI